MPGIDKIMVRLEGEGPDNSWESIGDAYCGEAGSLPADRNIFDDAACSQFVEKQVGKALKMCAEVAQFQLGDFA